MRSPRRKILPWLPSDKARVMAPHSVVENWKLSGNCQRALSVPTMYGQTTRVISAGCCPGLTRSNTSSIVSARQRRSRSTRWWAIWVSITPPYVQALDVRSMLTIGISKTVAPINSQPTAKETFDLTRAAGLNRQRTPNQAQLAWACGSSSPVVESHIANCLARGAG
jgi:hypothetical protein